MYKFTNGVVVFDKETRDAFIKSGLRLIKEEQIKNENNSKNESINREPKKVSKSNK